MALVHYRSQVFFRSKQNDVLFDAMKNLCEPEKYALLMWNETGRLKVHWFLSSFASEIENNESCGALEAFFFYFYTCFRGSSETESKGKGSLSIAKVTTPLWRVHTLHMNATVILFFLVSQK